MQRFNRKNALLVFSNYALNDEALKKQNAIAWYSKMLFTSLPGNKKVVVFSEKTKSNQRPTCDRKNVLVIPCWRRNDAGSLLSLAFFMARFPKARNFIFEFEFNIFGNVLGPLITFLLVLWAKILGKNVFFQIHQVVSDLRSLTSQVHINNPFLLYLLNVGIRLFYRGIGLLSAKVMVTEESLTSRIGKYVAKDKVELVALPVAAIRPMNRNKAQALVGKNLKNEFVILSFGYLSWYKGVDWLVDVFPKLKKNIPNLTLVVAGDKSPTLSKKPHYLDYYHRLKRKILETRGITHTGFISEVEVVAWFSLADVIVLPHRVFISSSGPLSWALSLKKPVVFSEKLKHYEESLDFAKARKKCKLEHDEIFFHLTASSLTRLLKNRNIHKLSRFSQTLALNRSAKKVAARLVGLIEAKNKAAKPRFAKSFYQLQRLLRFAYAH